MHTCLNNMPTFVFLVLSHSFSLCFLFSFSQAFSYHICISLFVISPAKGRRGRRNSVHNYRTETGKEEEEEDENILEVQEGRKELDVKTKQGNKEEKKEAIQVEDLKNSQAEEIGDGKKKKKKKKVELAENNSNSHTLTAIQAAGVSGGKVNYPHTSIHTYYTCTAAHTPTHIHTPMHTEEIQTARGGAGKRGNYTLTSHTHNTHIPDLLQTPKRKPTYHKYVSEVLVADVAQRPTHAHLTSSIQPNTPTPTPLHKHQPSYSLPLF